MSLWQCRQLHEGWRTEPAYRQLCRQHTKDGMLAGIHPTKDLQDLDTSDRIKMLLKLIETQVNGEPGCLRAEDNTTDTFIIPQTDRSHQSQSKSRKGLLGK